MYGHLNVKCGIEQNNYCLVNQMALIAVSHLTYSVSTLAGSYQNSGRKRNLKYQGKFEVPLSAIILAPDGRKTRLLDCIRDVSCVQFSSLPVDTKNASSGRKTKKKSSCSMKQNFKPVQSCRTPGSLC